MSYQIREIGGEADARDERLWADTAGTPERATSRQAEAVPLPADAQRFVAMREGRAVARLGCGVREGFSGAPGRIGYIGWYAEADPEVGAFLLREAAQRLIDSGSECVVAPLDGSTWYRYRVAVPRDREIENGGPFLSEPTNAPDWPAQFASAGFRPLLEYETRRVALPRPAASLGAKRQGLAERGVRLRSLDAGRYQAELRAVHALSLEAFAGNPFYTPIEFTRFEQLYGPLRHLIDPALVRLAESDDGRLLGYVFAFADPLAASGAPRLVLKTLAVSHEVRGWGLGAILVDEIHAAAASRRAAVLHALMQVTNASRGISRRSESELFRRYLLYEYVGG